MERSKLDFGCDRPSKDDFTASTVYYFRKQGAMAPIEFFEVDGDGNLVKYGSSGADLTSRTDIFMIYSGIVKYVFELKDRDLPHTSKWVIDPDEGEFMNPEKRDVMQRYKDEKEYNPMWAALYTDGKIRIWNLGKIDLNTLRTTTKSIKKINIDPDSIKRPQLRYLFPASASTVIDRLKG